MMMTTSYLLSPPYTHAPTPYRMANATILLATCSPQMIKTTVCSRSGPKMTKTAFGIVRFVLETIRPLASFSRRMRRKNASVSSSSCVVAEGGLSKMANEGIKRSVSSLYLLSAKTTIHPPWQPMSGTRHDAEYLGTTQDEVEDLRNKEQQ